MSTQATTKRKNIELKNKVSSLLKDKSKLKQTSDQALSHQLQLQN